MNLYIHTTSERTLKLTNILSRFRSCRTYSVVLHFGESGVEDGTDMRSVLRDLLWVCKCASGRRTINPCCHVIAVLSLFKRCRDSDFAFHTALSLKQTDTVKDTIHYRKWAELNETYCLCRAKYVSDVDMVGCDGCREWYHTSCIGMTSTEFQSLSSEWFCYRCSHSDDDVSDQESSDEDVMSVLNTTVDLRMTRSSKRRRLTSSRSSSSAK